MKKEVKYTVKGEEWDKAKDRAFNKLNKTHRIDGFRKGKATRSIFEKKFPGEIVMEAANNLIDKKYVEIINDKEIIPVVEPKVNITKIDDEDYAIKPMNCPGGMVVYKSRPHSYRELPIRCGELGIVHRHELKGALHGLFRVRCFTQDDAHIFMTRAQIPQEIKGVVRLIDEVYAKFGFKYHVELSTRPENSMGSDEDWEAATDGLRSALEELGLPYAVNEGDGAFYGPKIDFHLTDSIGRTWQCGTIQLDFQLPQRFDLSYTGVDGEKHRPIMIHRVVFGSVERFIGILIEHFAGAFPFWLAPVQVKVLPISEKYAEFAESVRKKLDAAGIRTEIDLRSEKIGYKIRSAQMEKVPYMMILGDKEAESGDVSIRARDGSQETLSLDAFIARAQKLTAEKTAE